ERDAVIYNEKQAVAALLEYDNAEVYFYQDDSSIAAVYHFGKAFRF
ncbi:MAG: hypothetical protein HFH94_12560, partial [Lachnospiraceae bacterium]|nr:hypothetical protein [Lachnospiraceae bacterium]